MKISGYIDDDLVPKINDIFLVGKNNQFIPLDVVIDTGFNDQFCLPEKFVGRAELKLLGTTNYILGDGSTIEDATYITEIIINNQPMQVVVTLTMDDEALLGTSLLDGKIVTLNFKDYTVTIEDYNDPRPSKK